MRCLILLFFLPVLAFAQMGNEDWTTPIADVKFEDGKIVYTYTTNDQPGYVRIHPVYFNKDLLVMKGVHILGGLDNDDMRKLYSQTDNYLETWQPALANNRDKYIFLEHCVLKILWEPQNKLSAHVLEVLDWLKENLSIDISESAGLVQKLYEDYNQKH